jgi:cytochrome c peroxidase
MTAAKVELGRHLFYDTRLSVNGKQSCASCHDQAKAFTDGKARAEGTTGEMHPRGSMSIVNIAYTPVLTWANPNMKQLERQALVPMFGEHPVELGLSGKESEALARLKAEPRYQRLFPEVFGKADPFTIENVTKAIAAFERVLISGDAPYDRYLNGQRNAISLAAKRGEELFFSERLECFHCHGGFNFAQSTDHAGKAFAEIEFHNTGLYNLDGKGAFPKDNQGAFEITQRAEDIGKFRAPTLRNIAVTAPYMHDGSIATLEEVLDHYAAGGRTITMGEYQGNGSTHPNKSSFVKGFTLTPREKRDVIAFLKSLTDEKFLMDVRFSDPWKTAEAKPGISNIGNPTGTRGISPNFTRTPDGRALLSWLKPVGAAGYALRFALRQGAAWAPPQTVDAAVSFSAPLQLNTHPALGRATVVWLPDDAALAAWAERGAGGGSQLLARRVAANGTLSAPLVIATNTKAFPRLERSGAQTLIVWSDAAGVKTAQFNNPVQEARHEPMTATSLIRTRTSAS